MQKWAFIEGGAAWELDLPRGRRWRLGRTPAIIGILNATPDSFSDGGLYSTTAEAVRAGIEMLQEGAQGLDVGGESTRPGAEPVPPGEQVRRVCPVVRALRQETDAPISVDTTSPEVAAEALDSGADIVNDVNGFREPGWQALLSHIPVPLVLVHRQGIPRDMQTRPEYPQGVIAAVERFFRERMAVLAGWGVGAGRVLLDPGIGFGKRVQDNLALIRNIEVLQSFKRPVYIGTSRKSFIGKILDRDVNERDAGTLAADAAAIFGGANVLRVHNVPATRDLVLMLAAIRDAPIPAREAE